ncbi:hypothetical protein CEXT_690721 [Caerostris extrusa]|uniref:Uncharacterized protein n=1 Tax=Caerostris extrusa TaxID=172846 RepID=A0AAV4VEE1_CAEEX|nr:hypothetical protein CEXT_690721 [Caerostris extrusa]
MSKNISSLILIFAYKRTIFLSAVSIERLTGFLIKGSSDSSTRISSFTPSSVVKRKRGTSISSPMDIISLVIESVSEHLFRELHLVAMSDRCITRIRVEAIHRSSLIIVDSVEQV